MAVLSGFSGPFDKMKQTSNPVAVLLTVRELDQGGIERDVARAAIHLNRSRYAPHVASYFNHGMRHDELKRAGVPMLHLPVRSLASLETLRQALRLWSYIRKHRIRLVHAWDTSAVFAVPLAKLMGVPVVLSSVLGDRQLLDERSRRQSRFTDRLVDAVVVNCEAMRTHLAEDTGVSGVRIELCYNGVDTKQFCPLATEARPLEVGDASLVIGAVCALRPEKALHLLQEAFAKVRHLRAGMKLLIVGSGGELPRLKANAVRLGIEAESVFVPATTDVPHYLRSIDIFVLCSLSEAFSNSLLEAMACGCAPVGSLVGGTPEMIGQDERRGLLFPRGEVEGLAQQMARLIRDDAMRKRLGGEAAAFAHNNLSLEKNVRRISEIYSDLLGGKGVASE
jgi:glycosyltransferase involved in cell wall biosynthesis